MDKEIKEYLDSKIESEFKEIWTAINELRNSKVSNESAVTKNDIKNLMDRVYHRR